MFKPDKFICVYADLRSSESPQATIPSALVSTPFRPDIVVCNSVTLSVALLELTCPLDTDHNILSARSRKQNKTEYLQLLAEFDRLQISNHYETLEISVLGHYQPSSILNIKRFSGFIKPSAASKANIRHVLDSAARISITCSQKFFMALCLVS